MVAMLVGMVAFLVASAVACKVYAWMQDDTQYAEDGTVLCSPKYDR